MWTPKTQGFKNQHYYYYYTYYVCECEHCITIKSHGEYRMLVNTDKAHLRSYVYEKTFIHTHTHTHTNTHTITRKNDSRVDTSANWSHT